MRPVARAMMNQLRAVARTVIVLLALWQGAVWLLAPPRFILPSPLAVLSVFTSQPGALAYHSLVTISEILLGFALGVMFGAVTAIAMAGLPRLARLVWPILLVLQAFPVFVLAPLLVVWFGFGIASKVIMATIIIFFPVTSAFADGLRRTDPDLLDAAALTAATPWQILLRIRLPLGLPGLISGLRVAAPLAPLGAVVGEWVGASSGLGFLMVQANARMQTDTVFAAMTVLAALSLLLRHGVDQLAPHLIPWASDQ